MVQLRLSSPRFFFFRDQKLKIIILHHICIKFMIKTITNVSITNKSKFSKTFLICFQTPKFATFENVQTSAF